MKQRPTLGPPITLKVRETGLKQRLRDAAPAIVLGVIFFAYFVLPFIHPYH